MLQISDYYELNALLKSMMVLKFEMDPSDPDIHEIVASPIVGRVVAKILDATVEAAKRRGDHLSASRLENGRCIDRDPAMIQFVKKCIRQDVDYWRQCNVSKKSDFVRTLLSPFTISDECLAALLVE